MFSVTAAVFAPQTELTTDSTVESADLNCQNEQSADFLSDFNTTALKESSAGCLVQDDLNSEPLAHQHTMSEPQTHQTTKSEKPTTKISRLTKRKRLDCNSK